MDDTTPITLSKFNTNYVIISYLIAREARLSFEARGLLSFLLTLPPNWTFYYKHIVKMSPGSMYKLRKTIAELRYIGAIEIKPNKLTREKALELTKLKNKQFKEGYFYGQKWRLIDPEKWALEANLDWEATPVKDSSGIADFGESENRKDGKSHTKNYKTYEVSNKRTTTTTDGTNRNEDESTELLYFPNKLTEEERKTSADKLKTFEHSLQQQILDQFEYNLRSGKIRNKDAPLAYVMGLVRKAQRNEFVFTAGVIAREREQRLNLQVLSSPKQDKKHEFKYDDKKRTMMFDSISLNTRLEAKV